MKICGKTDFKFAVAFFSSPLKLHLLSFPWLKRCLNQLVSKPSSLLKKHIDEA